MLDTNCQGEHVKYLKYLCITLNSQGKPRLRSFVHNNSFTTYIRSTAILLSTFQSSPLSLKVPLSEMRFYTSYTSFLPFTRRKGTVAYDAVTNDTLKATI